MVFVTRFAPSPTGYLHKGHAFSALTAWSAAQAVGGRFLLRIEDTDFTRCRPEYEAAVMEDLAWLGLDWEQPVRRQSEHRAEYDEALQRLRDMGVLYRCFRTRKELMALAGVAPHADDPNDPHAFSYGPHSAAEEAERLAHGEAFAWRLSLGAARDRLGDLHALTWIEERVRPGIHHAEPERLGDMVVGRKDIGAGYIIAAVLDDALQGVTHVIRGEDLIEVTSVQRVLQALLDLPTPVYRHHPLLLGPDGKRYAKRDKSVTLGEIRASGVTPDALRAELGF
ncbi:tRNA glutamyl-Q(34) synthetase GluQRS [Brevundimonas goettingensis]|uniref:tRNA glutamyl-Q(34) synthetase GluQRS n=1 Tax=Brevundimonas goettingensis TaxID=2774190 RepID=A0A975C0B2_9CAUL|nr:tRNA glutamyl-Q(34) synthetase GluQRS [Brevundimonas goettingensis]QTC91458.1 tRNA glutamyl-Q(34) synthetase GluQRS [Brevundimonas goettingensis]